MKCSKRKVEEKSRLIEGLGLRYINGLYDEASPFLDFNIKVYDDNERAIKFTKNIPRI